MRISDWISDVCSSDLAPGIGTAVLGDAGYRRLMRDLRANEHAIFVVSNGTESFKGSGFVRGGIFDRLNVAQELDTFTFRDQDYQNLYDVRAPGDRKSTRLNSSH